MLIHLFTLMKFDIILISDFGRLIYFSRLKLSKLSKLNLKTSKLNLKISKLNLKISKFNLKLSSLLKACKTYWIILLRQESRDLIESWRKESQKSKVGRKKVQSLIEKRLIVDLLGRLGNTVCRLVWTQGRSRGGRRRGEGREGWTRSIPWNGNGNGNGTGAERRKRGLYERSFLTSMPSTSSSSTSSSVYS